MSYSKINDLETETRMNNYARSTTFGDFQEVTDDEQVSIEFGMDPVIIYSSDYSLLCTVSGFR